MSKFFFISLSITISKKLKGKGDHFRKQERDEFNNEEESTRKRKKLKKDRTNQKEEGDNIRTSSVMSVSFRKVAN